MKKHLSIIIVFISVFFASACSSNSDSPNVIVDAGESVISYSLIAVERDDVISTKKLSSYYNKTSDTEISFDVTGKYVDKVYVREGDEVKKGDLLCELTYSSISEEISRLNYQIKRNELLLDYTYTNENLDIQDVWISSMNNSWMSDKDINENIQNIKDNYSRKRVLINDSLEFDRERLRLKKNELSASRLYAPMDGTVYKLKDDLEGSTTKSGVVIMTIVGNGEGIFEVKNIDDISYINDGDLLNLKVTSSGAAGDYIVTPFEFDSWENSMKFSVVSAPESSNLTVGVSGIISLLVDEKKNVLTLPKTIVHIADDKAFVYTLNENNDREIKYIEIGLIGDEKVEIISGLSEGEKVVKK